MNIEDTFGYQLAESRVVKGWTERQVAEAVNKAPRETSRPFTAQSVKDWQEFKSVPSKEIVEILAMKLIDGNANLDEARKQTMRDVFVKAADRDREALARGENLHDLFLEGQSPFGQMLNTMRIKNGLNEVQVAELFENEDPIGRVTTDTILRLQFGLEQPSPALAQCIAQVMQLDLKDVVGPATLTFTTMLEAEKGHEEIAATPNEQERDFEVEAANIGLELRRFLSERDELALLPLCMKPIKKGTLPPQPGSQQVPYKEGGTATARIVSAMNQQLNEAGALVGPQKLATWQNISQRWRELAEAHQRECPHAGVETAAALS